MSQPTTPPLTNPSPKARFQESADNVSKHRRMVDSGEYQRAIDFGMMQYAAELASQNKSPDAAMAMGLKLQGAIEFSQLVRNLSETPRVSRPVTSDNLTETN